MMTETLRWWLAATVIGLVAFPYAFRLFRFLPDRGYAAARPLGVVLVVYPLWLLSVAGILRYTAAGAVLVVTALGTGAIVLAGWDRAALAAHLRSHRAMLIACELVFAATLVALAAFRAYAPEINATEKPFELSMLTGVLSSERMPPADPWFNGTPLSYYYGGYLVTGLFIKLTAVPVSYGFNLGIALTGALTAVAVFGVGANLALMRTVTRMPRRAPRPVDGAADKRSTDSAGVHVPDGGVGEPSGPTPRAISRTALTAAIAAGTLSVLLLLVIGNLEGAIEFAAAHGWGTPAFWQRLGIVNFTGLVTTKQWYPDEFWFWWRATRLGSDWNIMEMPFFSLMLGDLHAHIMVLPFTLLALTAVLNLLRGGERLGLDTLRRRPVQVLILGMLTGMLAMSNTWDQPVFLVLLFAAALTLNFAYDGLSGRALLHAVIFAVPVAVLSFALYVPFFRYLQPASLALRPVELNRLPEGINGEGMVLPPHHFLIFWGPLLLAVGSGVVTQALRRRVGRAPAQVWKIAAVITCAPLLVWAAAVMIANRSVTALAEEVQARATWWAFGSYWLVQIGVLALVLLALVVLLDDARHPHPERRAARTYTLLTVTAGLLLLHGIELFYFEEQAIASRINTLFKFSYIVWLLLATAGGAMVIDLLRGWVRRPARPAIALWSATALVVLALALVYPVTAAMNRTDGFSATPTLDGLAWLRTSEPDEYAAITWLRDALPGRPTILEAAGHVYSNAGRVSGRTGLPTVIGWQEHEAKLRGGRDYAGEVQRITARAADVEAIYRTTDPEQARDLLRRYAVDYVYVGALEVQQYGAAGMDKFARLGQPVYRNRSVTIYQIGDAPPLLMRR